MNAPGEQLVYAEKKLLNPSLPAKLEHHPQIKTKKHARVVNKGWKIWVIVSHSAVSMFAVSNV